MSDIMQKVCYLTRIFNEERLIGYQLQYYYNLGIRNFYITFNNSNIETIRQVDKFLDKNPDANCCSFFESNTAYRQIEVFDDMSNRAYDMGHVWQIPSDADELLVLKGISLEDFIKKYDNNEFGYINFRWIDYMPTHLDDQNDPNFFTRWQYREPASRPPTKIIYKWHPLCKHGHGNHLLIAHRRELDEIHPSLGFYAHFVNREKEQIKKKRIRIGEAFSETYGPDSEKPQVKEYREWQKRGDVYFDEVWKNLCQEREQNFSRYIHDPIKKELFT
jgi:hypothetical protein